MTYTYKYPKPSVTLDAVVFRLESDLKISVLLIRRKKDPFGGQWAFPGGFLEIEEDLLPGALRELKEETGLELGSMEQLGAFGTPDRDPRGRTISIAYLELLTNELQQDVKADTDAADADWFKLTKIPSLAFDHQDILIVALERLKRHLNDALTSGTHYKNLNKNQLESIIDHLK